MKFGQLDDMDGVNFSFQHLSDKSKSYISKNSSNQRLKVFIGAPVWADKNYIGSLYPLKTRQKDFLKAYAMQFNSIEVNATRYGTPKLEVIDKWKDSVADSFKFSFKIPQVITHRKCINDDIAKQRMDQFIVALDHLGNKSGISFAVMANYFKADQMDELVRFVENLPIEMKFAIEFRDHSWFETKAMDEWQGLFNEKNIIPVLTDTPGRRDAAHFRLVNNHLFVRYVGDFADTSDLKRIDLWVSRLIELVDYGVDTIWFYAHQPGESRERVVLFFNTLINKINPQLNTNIPILVNYSNN